MMYLLLNRFLITKTYFINANNITRLIRKKNSHDPHTSCIKNTVDIISRHFTTKAKQTATHNSY